MNIRLKKVVLMAVLFSSCLLVFASVTKSWKDASTGISGLECRIEEIRTTSSEWLKDSDRYHFRTTNGKGGKVKVDFSKSTFHNCKVVYSHCYVSSTGEWGGHAIEIEALSHDPWNYDLHYYLEWQ